MKVQIVILHRPWRFAFYRLKGGLFGLMLGRVELRLRFDWERHAFIVREP